MRKCLWWILRHAKTRKGVVSGEMLRGVKNKCRSGDSRIDKRQLSELKHLISRKKRKQNNKSVVLLGEAVKCRTLDGDSPIAESITSLRSNPSSMGHLTGFLGVKYYFGAGYESGTKSRQTLNTRYDFKITGVEGCRGSREVCLEAATLERVRNSSLMEHSCVEDERG
ncbi:hypothetical protein ES288_D02G188900v1 [Gossypium darwinii]|uniref:Uncharacterized protein n=1 Tax=Gossypium darwinii TaxID=34276 RepID=A0A5D2DI84_GOSDA|nr:hypothetical protein ES288_D02G188900v1 [Gossypium darwinii]